MSKIYFVFKFVFSLAASVYLFTFGFWFKRNRTLIDRISGHFGLHPGRVWPKIPKADLAEWVPVPPPIKIVRSAFEDGGVNLDELTALSVLVSCLRPRRLFEIGSFTGRTTENLAANAPRGAQIYTLDLPAGAPSTVAPLDPGDKKYVPKGLNRVQKRPSLKNEGAKIEKLYGDSLSFDFSPYKSKMDFIFVDGSHAETYVRSDSYRALEMLRRGRGLIVWHDYDAWDGVTRALNELENHFPHPLVWLRGTHLVCCFAGLTPPLGGAKQGKK